MEENRSNKSQLDNKEKVVFRITKISLFFFHLLLLAFFALNGSKHMIVISTISVIIYFCMLLFTADRPGLFWIITYSEVTVYTIATVLTLGWDFGFQNYLLGIIPCTYYCSYMMRKMKNRFTINPLYYSIASGVIFLLLRQWWIRYSYRYASIDPLGVSVVLDSINCVIAIGSLLLFFTLYYDMTFDREKELSTDAETDLLTGLSNRRTMLLAMDKAERMAIKKGQLMAASIIDIDNFKHVNDNYGHDVGDIVLKTLAKEIKEIEQTYLTACRWGGEEFVFLCVGGRAYEDLLEQMTALMHKMAAMKIEYAPGRSLSVTITCGIALAVPGEGSTALVKRADEYLYYGKTHGKNQVVTEIVYKKGQN